MRPCRPRQDIQWHLVGYTDTQRGDQRAPSVCRDEWGCGVSHRRESCRMVGRACRQDYRCIRTPHGRASCVWEEESWLRAKASTLERGACRSRKQMCKLLRWRCGALKTRAVNYDLPNLYANATQLVAVRDRCAPPLVMREAVEERTARRKRRVLRFRCTTVMRVLHPALVGARRRSGHSSRGRMARMVSASWSECWSDMVALPSFNHEQHSLGRLFRLFRA